MINGSPQGYGGLSRFILSNTFWLGRIRIVTIICIGVVLEGPAALVTVQPQTLPKIVSCLNTWDAKGWGKKILSWWYVCLQRSNGQICSWNFIRVRISEQRVCLTASCTHEVEGRVQQDPSSPRCDRTEASCPYHSFHWQDSSQQKHFGFRDFCQLSCAYQGLHLVRDSCWQQQPVP